MKAAVFVGPNKPLEIQDTPLPTIGDTDILVKVTACGVCHTDLHYIDHGVPTFKKPPLILGHEASGVVQQAGSKVKRFKEGDRVLIPAVLTCGQCSMCRQGRENICQNMKMLGNHIDGAFAEYVSVDSKDIIPLPDELDLEEACIIADAVSTPFHAIVNRAKVRAADRVAIFGCGGVGLNAVQIAHAVGATVFAVDVDERKLGQALELGAFKIINNRDSKETLKQIREATEGGVDIAFECIGRPETIQQAHQAVRAGGRLCIIGYSQKNAEIAVSRIMFFEQEIIGSLGCRPADYPRIIQLVTQKKIRLEPLITGRYQLDEINNAFKDLRNGTSIRSIILP